MSLHIYTGPMFSGKTTQLLLKLSEYSDITKDNPLLINSSLDTRQKDKIISSHSSQYQQVSSHIDILYTNKLADVDVTNYRVIGVDEAQFFPDLYETICLWVNTYDKTVFCSGLSVDANCNLFGCIYKLLTICDSFNFLSAKCIQCHKDNNILNNATFTAKINNNISPIDIGGDDKYMSLCRTHYYKHYSTFS